MFVAHRPDRTAKADLPPLSLPLDKLGHAVLQINRCQAPMAFHHSDAGKGAAMPKETKTFAIGRDAKTGRLMSVADAKRRPASTTVERMPKPGRGDTK